MKIATLGSCKAQIVLPYFRRPAMAFQRSTLAEVAALPT